MRKHRLSSKGSLAERKGKVLNRTRDTFSEPNPTPLSLYPFLLSPAGLYFSDLYTIISSIRLSFCYLIISVSNFFMSIWLWFRFFFVLLNLNNWIRVLKLSQESSSGSILWVEIGQTQPIRWGFLYVSLIGFLLLPLFYLLRILNISVWNIFKIRFIYVWEGVFSYTCFECY